MNKETIEQWKWWKRRNAKESGHGGTNEEMRERGTRKLGNEGSVERRTKALKMVTEGLSIDTNLSG